MNISTSKPLLISVVGPTATGKTALAIYLAKHFGTEVINADSRQMYKQMSIGTAKPTVAEMDGILHHFLDFLDIHQPYNAGMFERDVLDFLADQFQSKNPIVMVGGSGLYCKAVWEGLDEMPEVDLALRQELNEHVNQQGLTDLLTELAKGDPVYLEQADKQNRQRIIRAVEVLRTTGRPYSSYWQQKKRTERPFIQCKIGLELDREHLYEKINNRVDQMMEQGLLAEVENLYTQRHLNALQTVGYSELFSYLDGSINLEEAIRLIKRNTRHFAKRQLTWFKKDPQIRWFHPSDYSGVAEFIQNGLNT